MDASQVKEHMNVVGSIGSADGGLCIGLSGADGILSEELLIGAANMQFVDADASSWPSYNFSKHAKRGSTMRSSAECYAEAERLERKARTAQVARTRELDYGASMLHRPKSGRKPSFARLPQTRSE